MSTHSETSGVAPTLETAFAALATYDRGSGRATIRPIDEAVNAARTPESRAHLERRLLAVLRRPASVVAKEYACGKLALIGGPDAVAVLADLLPHPELAHPATHALQLMPCAEAGAALRERLTQLDGLPLIGVIAALGARREAASVERLARRLADPDVRVASAAAAALGQIGSSPTAAALRTFLPKAPPALRPALADACLVCAERLKDQGDTTTARTLAEALLATAPAEHVQAAARRLGAG